MKKDGVGAIMSKMVQFFSKLKFTNGQKSRSGSHAQQSILQQQLGKVKLLQTVGGKLFLMIFLCTVGCVLAVGGLSYQTSKNIVEKKVSDAYHQAVIQASEKLDVSLQNYETISNQLLNDQDMQILLSNTTIKDEADRVAKTQKLNEKFRSYISSDANIYGIHLIPIKAGYTGFSSSGTMLTNFDKTPWLAIIEQDGKPLWLDSRATGFMGDAQTPTLAVGRTAKEKVTGQSNYVLLIEIKVDKLKQQLSSIEADGSQLVIVNGKNSIIHSDNVGNLGKDYELAKKLINEEGKPILSDTKQISDGGDLLAVVHNLKLADWRLIQTLPLDALLNEANKIFLMTLVMTIIAAAIAVGIGLLCARMIGKPLTKLSDLMSEGERGNLAVRADFLQRNDEIGRLGGSFNQMMGNIMELVDKTNRTAHQVLTTSGKLNDASKRTATAAREIASATEEIANGASSLAVESERGNDLTISINDQMSNLVRANETMSNVAEEVAQASQSGVTYMKELTAKTQTTEQMTQSMFEKVEQLKDSTQSIRKIVDLLSGITSQTNILSLNASIEAARAGAAGKGFMVVADEIRKLADQSRESIKIVGQMTEKIQTEMNGTVNLLSDAYPLYQEQILSVKQASEIFEAVRNRMSDFENELKSVVGSVHTLEHSQQVLAETMENVSAVAQQSSATSEEVASLSSEQLTVSENLVNLSDELENASEQLKQSLSKFRTH